MEFRLSHAKIMPTTAAAKSKRRKRGRPAGRPTVRVCALLYVEQKDELDFLSDTMEGNPPVVRIIREAISQYVTSKMRNREISEAFKEHRDSRLRIIR